MEQNHIYYLSIEPRTTQHFCTITSNSSRGQRRASKSVSLYAKLAMTLEGALDPSLEELAEQLSQILPSPVFPSQTLLPTARWGRRMENFPFPRGASSVHLWFRAHTEGTNFKEKGPTSSKSLKNKYWRQSRNENKHRIGSMLFLFANCDVRKRTTRFQMS